MLRISPSELRHLAVKILELAGADEAEAQDLSEVLIWADQRDQAPQGTIWLDVLTQRLLDGDAVSPAEWTVEQTHAAARSIDAGHGLGHVVALHATDWASAAAKEAGIAIAKVSESSHFGACGFYAARLAANGLVGIVATNAFPKVAPHGGLEAVLGTNPIAIAAPVDGGEPIIADLSTGSTAGSRIRAALAEGELLDPGAALDRDGRPTRDPAAMQDGGIMLPFGGAKGSALGLMIEILTSGLSGGAPPDRLGSMFSAGHARSSHVIIAIDADHALGSATSHLRDLFASAKTQPGGSLRLPGDRGHRAAARDFVELNNETVQALRQAAARVGLDPDGILS